MKLIGTIKSILVEESKRDLTSVIQTLLDGFVKDHEDVVCKVEVKHPDNRTKLPHQEYPYNNYRVDFYLIGGYGSDNWPATQSVRRMFDDLMNEAWDLVYNYTGQKLEMFTKNVKSCDDIIKEDKDNSISDMIKTLGVSDAIKYFGNYYKIEPYLKEIDKVNYIKEKVYELNDGRSINLSVINGDTIHYSEKDGKLQLIEWLGKENVTVKTYGDNDNYIGTFYVNYESLPSQIIEELVEIFINR
jgi:hypothetical protein